ncbi:F-actin-capping protein subunit alpha-3 [Varanus komodoensis]|uniref:F-actin-capping protein subunit alpha-3 n=1 Tax=Varanus komodoensis TaxID=61221 RepID=UPI001CF7A4D9|nr:F-actin-capping protein subunit alpha-3 [Varanus komodoensis]
MSEELSTAKKIECICSMLRQAPPGEFRNVFEDLCLLVCDEHLMRFEAAQVCANHTRNNFTAVKVRGDYTLVSRFNDLGGNRFFDPQIKLSFRFDHLTARVDKVLLYKCIRKDNVELWRETLNVTLESYMKRHFYSGGCRVYRKTLRSSPFLVVCIESHQYEKFWNGLWKSEWIIAFTPPTTQITGKINLQIHYFEKANLHWTVSKVVKDSIHLINRTQFVLDLAKLIEAEDDKFQIGIMESLQVLSANIWRTLRRHLPITRTAIHWEKLLSI